MALYWTSGSDWNLAAGGSHWSLIDELEQKIRTLRTDRPAAPDPPDPKVDRPAMEETSDDRSSAGWGRQR